MSASPSQLETEPQAPEKRGSGLWSMRTAEWGGSHMRISGVRVTGTVQYLPEEPQVQLGHGGVRCHL